MKKLLLCLMVVLFFLSPIFADQQETRAKIAKIRKEIVRLEGKLKDVAGIAQRKKIQETIFGHHARIRKLEEALVYQQIAVPPPAAPILPAPLPEPVLEKADFSRERERPPVVPKPQQPQRESRFKFELGATAGVFASTTAVNLEMRLPLVWIVGPAKTSLRGSGSFSQTENADRRYAFTACDGILNFPAGWLTGVENYFGAGLNYTNLTTGQRSGALGGQLFYGIESEGFGGRIFGEVGWAILRTGFSSSNRGVSVLLGYRRQVGLF